jgi:hypothetical protein
MKKKVQNLLNYKAESGKETEEQCKISAEYTRADMEEDYVQTELLKGMSDKFYPPHWLAFVTMGKVAGTDGLTSFNGGKGKKRKEDPKSFTLMDIAGMRDGMSKSSRKVVDKALDTGSSEKGSRNDVLTIVHQGLGNEEKGFKEDVTILMIEKQITTKRDHISLCNDMLTMLDGTDDISKWKGKKMTLMIQMSDLYEQKEKRYSAIANASSAVMLDLSFDTPIPSGFPIAGQYTIDGNFIG